MGPVQHRAYCTMTTNGIKHWVKQGPVNCDPANPLDLWNNHKSRYVCENIIALLAVLKHHHFFGCGVAFVYPKTLLLPSVFFKITLSLKHPWQHLLDIAQTAPAARQEYYRATGCFKTSPLFLVFCLPANTPPAWRIFFKIPLV